MIKRIPKKRLIWSIVALVILVALVGVFKIDKALDTANDTAAKAMEQAMAPDPVLVLDEPIAYSASFKGDGTEEKGAWAAASCTSGKLGPILRTNGQVEYLPDEYKDGKPVDFSATAEFDENGMTNKVIFSTPGRAIDEIIPLNVVNRDVSSQALWAKEFYSPGLLVDTVAIVPPEGETSFFSGSFWLLCASR